MNCIYFLCNIQPNWKEMLFLFKFSCHQSFSILSFYISLVCVNSINLWGVRSLSIFVFKWVLKWWSFYLSVSLSSFIHILNILRVTYDKQHQHYKYAIKSLENKYSDFLFVSKLLTIRNNSNDRKEIMRDVSIPKLNNWMPLLSEWKCWACKYLDTMSKF